MNLKMVLDVCRVCLKGYGTSRGDVALVGCRGDRCQVRVYSGKGSGQVWTKTDGGQGQRAGQEISPAGVGDRLDSTTKDNER